MKQKALPWRGLWEPRRGEGVGAREEVLRNVGGDGAWHGAGANETSEGGTETAGEQKE